MPNISPCKIFAPPSRATCRRPGCTHCDYVRANLIEAEKDSIVLGTGKFANSSQGFGLTSYVSGPDIVSANQARALSFWQKVKAWLRDRLQ